MRAVQIVRTIRAGWAGPAVPDRVRVQLPRLPAGLLHPRLHRRQRLRQPPVVGQGQRVLLLTLRLLGSLGKNGRSEPR